MCQYIFQWYGYMFVRLVELPQWGGSDGHPWIQNLTET